MKKNLFLITFALISIYACTNRNGSEANQQVDTTILNEQGVVLENDTLTGVLAAYIKLKDALVSSDARLASDAANNLAESLKTIHGCENTAMLAQELANSTDLALQRTAFSTISKDLIAMYLNVSLNSGEIYVMHCPMYNNNQGGDWLSTSTEIKNPYFGKEMLTCGTVTQEIK